MFSLHLAFILIWSDFLLSVKPFIRKSYWLSSQNFPKVWTFYLPLFCSHACHLCPGWLFLQVPPTGPLISIVRVSHIHYCSCHVISLFKPLKDSVFHLEKERGLQCNTLSDLSPSQSVTPGFINYSSPFADSLSFMSASLLFFECISWTSALDHL